MSEISNCVKPFLLVVNVEGYLGNGTVPEIRETVKCFAVILANFMVFKGLFEGMRRMG